MAKKKIDNQFISFLFVIALLKSKAKCLSIDKELLRNISL